jgi:hypothetical protein
MVCQWLMLHFLKGGLGSIVKCDARRLCKTLTTNNMLKSLSFFFEELKNI